jgi:hypothetical protein
MPFENLYRRRMERCAMQFLLLLPELPRPRDGGFTGRVANDVRSNVVSHHRTSIPAVRQGYQILALCRNADTRAVSDSMRKEFGASGIEVASLGVEYDSGGALARVCARVRCSNPERSGLVRLTNRLSLMPELRSIQWKSVTDAAAGQATKGIGSEEGPGS